MASKIKSTLSVPKMLITQILSLLSKKDHLQAFSEQYLNSIPERGLSIFSHKDWAEFLTKRFSFFNHTITKDFSQGVFIIKDIENMSGRPQKSLEIFCADASYIVITLEALFKLYGFPITKLFHPIISANVQNRKLLSVDREDINASLISAVYLEFEATASVDVFQAFEKQLALILSSIQFSYNSQDDILLHCAQVKSAIEKHQFNLSEPQSEWANLLDWLKSGNFSFYGYAAVNVEAKKRTLSEQIGILDARCLATQTTTLLQELETHNIHKSNFSEDFQFDTLAFKSPVQRIENLMRLSLKIPNPTSGYTEHIFLGLLKRSSLFVKNIETPIIHLKMKYIFDKKQMIPGSYDHTEVIRIFTSIPKFELFRLSSEELLSMAEDLLSITNPNKVYCFIHGKAPSWQLFIVIPHALFSKPNLNLVVAHLKSIISHDRIEVIEIRGDEKSRLHIHIEGSKDKTLSAEKIENEIRDLIKPWDETLREVLREAYPGKEGVALGEKYVQEFPSHYRAIRNGSEALKDIQFLEKSITHNCVCLNLVPFEFSNSALAGKASILSIYSQNKIDLMTIMPVLQNFGLHVYDEITTSVGPQRQSYGYIHSFRVVDEEGQKIEESSFLNLLDDMVKEIFNDRTLNDPLNRLVLKASLGWRNIQILQAYRNYLCQLGGHYSKEKLTTALLNYPRIAKFLFDYFDTKFSPTIAVAFDKRKQLLTKLEKDFSELIVTVEDVSDDLSLKALFSTIKATLRTNFYMTKKDNHTVIALKLDSHAVPGIPAPVPYREIFIYDVGVEGIHLRFGAVARGGLRWSDRLDDFRTEVLSLVKTQQVKNVVIVPVGSKGGFILKKKVTRETAPAEGIKQYKLFISGLLDITDNVDAAGEILHPESTIIYDQDDPYLVVAADKGTANFSDIANEISEDYHFWLGDAFASGGSVGYNHKKEAITARGAWECTKLHFKELGKDITEEVITVAGIGDMSGDVFGNGMLLSKKIKLQAAFNHVNIFLDPDPDPEASWKERKRLFDLPRSAWTDYNRKLISKGGGIFDRKAKEIALTPEIQKLLDVKKSVLTGEELIRAILKMQVDLIWFGGIGTYIRASDETSAEVGDQANDAVRIETTDCRALVISEGANLGLTQKARIDFNRRGGLINTDAIDNSAGVNMSDYEVNIKILLKRMLTEKKLSSMSERNILLEKATDQVSELVLANNRGQHRLISMDVMRTEKQFQIFSNLIQTFVTQGIIDPVTENLPSAAELDHLFHTRQPLSRPVLAVMQAYVKMQVYQQLVDADFLEDAYLDAAYQGYFPTVFIKAFGEQIHKHHLKKPILATLLTNKIINQAGTSFYFQCQVITGKPIEEITKAYLLVDAILDTSKLRTAIFSEAKKQDSLYTALIKLEHFIQSVVIAILQINNNVMFELIKPYEKTFKALKDSVTTKSIKISVSYWQGLGFKEATAKQLAILGQLDSATDVLFLHYQENIPVTESALLSKAVNQTFHFEWLKNQLNSFELTNNDEIELRNSAFAILEHKKILLFKKFVDEGFIKEIDPLDTSLNRELVRFLKTRDQYGLFEGYLHQVNEMVHHNISTNLISLSVALNRFPL